MEGVVRAWRVELLGEAVEELEPVGGPDLPKLCCQRDRETRHDELVQRICLHVEVERELKCRCLGLGLGPEGNHLVQAVLVEVLSVEAGRPQQCSHTFLGRASRLEERSKS